MSVNRVILIGYLGADPQVKYLTSGDSVVSFSVATSDKYKDRSGQQQERTDWHNVTVFGKLAALCSQYLAKGRQVYIEGALRYDKYTDKKGEKRTATKIIAQRVQFLSTNARREEENDTPPDEDIPF